MIRKTFEPPPSERYFEDYHPGTVYEFGPFAVDEQEMLAFARRFDPQDYHTDPEAAKNTIFGGVIASGWFTCALMMKYYAEDYLAHGASLASGGLDELRWPKPVRAGDVLRLRIHVTSARRSVSKPDRGIVHNFIEVVNQNDEVVMHYKGQNFFKCRNPG